MLQGVHLPAGSKLGVCLLSANRDENEWPHPERFDLTRRDQGAHRAELTLDQLREAFDAVVLATGLHTDEDPGVPGGDLPGVLGAGGATRWLNGDPGECAGRTDSGTLLGGSTAVIGMGNVAMDVDPLARQARHRSRGLGHHGRGIHGGPRRFAPAERTRRRMPGHQTRGGRAVRRGMAAQDSGGSGDGSGGVGTAPLTILFGTESGNAELVAQSLAAHVRDRFAVTVQDLADTDPAALDTSHPHVAVCSTYGGGELPTSARAFATAVAEGAADLSGVRYAAFGLGNRTYGETFSRGVVVLDETLAAAGASRFGDAGRHDAAEGRPPARQACEWPDGIAELSRVPAPRAPHGK